MNKTLVLFVGLVLMAVGQSYLFALDGVFLWVVGWAFLRDERQACYAAALGGLMASLLTLTPLGLMSLLYLLGLGFLMVLRRVKIVREPTLALFAYTIVVLVAQQILLDSLTAGTVFVHFHIVRLLFDLLLLSLVVLFYAIFIGPKEQEPLRLKT